MQQILKRIPPALLALFATMIIVFQPTSQPYVPSLTFESPLVAQLEKHLHASRSAGASAYETQREITAEIVTPKIPFTSLGLEWNEYIPPQTRADIAVRFLQDNRWTEWNTIPRDVDHKEEGELDLHADGKQSAFLPTNRSTAYQYKITLTSNGSQTPTIKNIAATVLNAEDSPEIRRNIQYVSQITQDMVAQERMSVISRAEWGADESIRVYKGDLLEVPVYKMNEEYLEKFSDELQIVKKATTNEKGELLSWPLEYPAKISKIIVHHTASTANLQDPKKAIRDIYNWHAKGRGWGDIGYNYIIDPQGNVYEGRAGGEKVIGAHAGKANTGSIGISVMGNFETAEVSEKALVSLTRIISEKTKIHHIDPAGSSVFRGERMPNIIGHRDVMSTSCPGKNLYDKLPLIAQLARSAIKTTVQDATFNKQKKLGYDFEDLSGLLFVDLDPEQQKTLTFTIKNTGTVTWNSETSLAVKDMETVRDFVQVVTPPGRETFSMTQPHSVAPGETATFQLTLVGGLKSSLKILRIVPVIDGKTKLTKRIELSTQTSPAQFTYDIISTSSVPTILKVGEKFTFTVDLKNTGNISWQNKGHKNVRLGTEQPRDRLTSFLSPPATRAGFLQQEVVRPGDVGHFVFNLTAPKIADVYEEYFTPVVEGITWMPNKNIHFSTFVYEKDFAATPVALSSIEIHPETTRAITIRMRNIGGATWTSSNAPELRRSSISRLKVVGSSMQDEQVLPGQIGNFQFQLQAPKGAFSGKLKIDAYRDGKKMTTRPLMMSVKRAKSPTQQPSAPTQPTQSSSKGNNIRVLLGYSGTPVISGNGPFSVKAGSYSANFSANTKVTVKSTSATTFELSAPGFAQTLSELPRFVPDANTMLRIDNWERRPSWDQALNDNEFRGALEVRADGGTMTVINELPLEDYMLGLAETINTEPMEKKKAIVIAARTYAYYYSNSGKGKKFPGKSYDLDDNPDHSQKYLGYGYEKRSPNSVTSVKETSGTIMKYLGNVVITPYFSTSDGRTRSAMEVWNWQNAAYLPSIDDPYCTGMKQNGHGVGMSGCGALGMAKNGKSYAEILSYYYKGIAIEKIY